MRIKDAIFLIFSTLLLFGCQPKITKTQVSEPAFYYWKSIFNLENTERKLLEELNVEKLYLKFFDVKKTPAPHPIIVAKTRINWEDFPKNKEVCPTVFITNQVFKDISKGKIDTLANHIYEQIISLAKTKDFNELQIDCDWSGKTKENYFLFLKKIKAYFPNKTLSGTIRLHQVKYRKQTGIPPLDKGMLMIYNISNPTIYSPKNSIFEKKEALKYIKNQKIYPIHLDIALPLFSWGIHFKNKKFKGFLSHFNNNKASEQTFLEKAEDNFYSVKKDTVLQKQYLRKGDKIKIEEIETTDLQSILRSTFPLLKNDTFHLSLYHLDEKVLRNYKNHEIESLFKISH